MSHYKPDLGVIENAEDNFITLKEKGERGERENFHIFGRKKRKRRSRNFTMAKSNQVFRIPPHTFFFFFLDEIKTFAQLLLIVCGELICPLESLILAQNEVMKSCQCFETQNGCFNSSWFSLSSKH